MDNIKLKKYLEYKKLTAFQKKVLSAISKIPKGEVRSYKWVARRIKHPDSFRAVGQALKRNPFPVMIPCHRVVRNDLKLGGFAFGKRRKQKLLEKEGLTVRNGIVIIQMRPQLMER